jgi:hypothetical protein
MYFVSYDFQMNPIGFQEVVKSLYYSVMFHANKFVCRKTPFHMYKDSFQLHLLTQKLPSRFLQSLCTNMLVYQSMDSITTNPFTQNGGHDIP